MIIMNPKIIILGIMNGKMTQSHISQNLIKRLHMKERIQRYIAKIVTFRGRIFRFFGWWFAFLGLYSVSAACPFCGQVGCPVGVGSAGIVAGFFAILVQSWNALTIFVKREKRK